MYVIKHTARFQKDLRLMQKRGCRMELLTGVIKCLASGGTLSAGNRDHPLNGNWSGYRECHITPDWLLIYRVDEDVLVLTLTRTGSHSDLF